MSANARTGRAVIACALCSDLLLTACSTEERERFSAQALIAAASAPHGAHPLDPQRPARRQEGRKTDKRVSIGECKQRAGEADDNTGQLDLKMSNVT